MSDQPSENTPPSGVDEGTGVTILSTLMSGLLLYGGLGWLADRVFDTSVLIAVGLVSGLILSLYTIIKRYGSSE